VTCCAKGSLRCVLLAAAAAAAFAVNVVHAGLPVQAQRVAGGFDSPVDIASTGAGRLLVVEQPGTIRLLRNDVLQPAPFLDIRPLVAYGGERGLLGIALHPQFAVNGRFYVDYTRVADGATVIAAFRVSAANPDVADAASRSELLTIAQPFENHNGGALRFGPDGYLYIGMGDGGSANDPGNRAQNPQELLGKMLRIDVDGVAPYAIPADNVYAVSHLGRPEIWALGVRNPWRFSFDRATGDLYIGDVGQDTTEEIDFLPRGTPSGANLGWRFFEGMSCTMLDPCPPGLLSFTWPILTYGHDQGCAVTGGVVYRGSAVPVMQGRYLYADFCSGRMWSAGRDRDGNWQTEILLETGQQPTTFGEDSDGEVYWADMRDGSLYRLAALPAAAVAVEYYNAALGHYFLTAFPEEAAALDAGAFGGAWKRTGFGFAVAPPADTGAVDVCRFFGTPHVGPNTHFYTGNAQECAALQGNALWTYEGTAFRMRMPASDSCAAPLHPVYRLYNNPSTLAAVNHRFTTDGATYSAMREAGWLGEGVAFCAN